MRQTKFTRHPCETALLQDHLFHFLFFSVLTCMIFLSLDNFIIFWMLGENKENIQNITDLTILLWNYFVLALHKCKCKSFVSVCLEIRLVRIVGNNDVGSLNFKLVLNQLYLEISERKKETKVIAVHARHYYYILNLKRM